MGSRATKGGGPAGARNVAELVAARLSTRAGTVLRFLKASLMEPRVAVVPSKIIFAPETLIAADPDEAADIYAGVFALAGEVVDGAGRSPFVLPPPSEAWERALHGFSWLVHLEANATALSSTNGRALVEEWLDLAAGGRAEEDPAVVAERLTAWLVEAPLLMNGAEAPFRARFLRAVGRHMRRLERAVTTLPDNRARLRAAVALALAATVTVGEERLMKKALAALVDTLDAQILPDGGHASRSPAALMEALRAVIPLIQALERRQLAVPQGLAAAADRMMPMVRFFRGADGMLAPFHGTGVVDAATVDALLAHDYLEGRPTDNARHSGFQRLSAGDTVVLMDTGTVPPPLHAHDAHASTLSFQLTCGGARVIGACGALGEVRADWTDAARASVAHSQPVVAATSCAAVPRGSLRRLAGTAICGGPTAVAVSREGLTVTARHDAYEASYGLVLERTLALAPDGLRLDGLDRLVGGERVQGTAFTIRFHLGPDAKVKLERERRQAMVTLPDGAIWLFVAAEGPTLAVEDSVALVAPHRARRTLQLVLSANALTEPKVRWRVARRAGPLGAEHAGGAAPGH